jgi:formylglycine-generating enzyme required for sulfatase activity
MRFHHIIAVAWLIAAAAVAPAHADKRVALVIGNGAYRHADPLAIPVNDARAVRDVLRSPALGFDVIYGEDLDRAGLQRVIEYFAGILNSADVALVYFAGHGATFGGMRYVVPVDAGFSNIDQAPGELIAVEALTGELSRAKGVRIAIFDANRENSAERALKQQHGDATHGLVRPAKNSDAMIIAYAGQYLSTAPDPDGGLSAFTDALVHNITTPGLDVKDLFFKVGRDVAAATGGRQRPEISVSIYAPYVLAPPPGAGAADEERAAQTWGLVKDTASLAVVDEFIQRYGNVPIYGSLARARREELAKLAAPPLPAGAAPLTAAQERGLRPKDAFRECKECPEMEVLPAGAFTMGSPAGEQGRDKNEGPQHVVTLARPFAAGKFHVTRDQFAAFVQATGYAASSKCSGYGRSGQDGNVGGNVGGNSWRNPGFAQEGSHPVVCVTWNDAKAYVDWLASKTGKPYRLLSEAEWEYAARGGTSPGAYPRYWFGNDARDICRYGNGDASSCNDGYAYTAPAGQYQPNAFGLYDMAGNARQWTADCYHDSYAGAPADGSAWTTGCGTGRVVRGSAFDSNPQHLRAAGRTGLDSEGYTTGFRVARTLTP